MRLPMTALASSMLACAGARLEQVDTFELERRLAAAVAAGEAPGVVFGAAFADGGMVLRAAGSERLRPRREAAVETPYPWFSLTKLFTATAIVQLAEQGRLDLDAPVDTYLPERSLERGGRKATVRHLLAHAAGMRNPVPITWIHLATEEGPTLETLTARLLAEHGDLAFEPGEKSDYSNLGYLLLGQIVERVSGEPFGEYVARHVLAPLGCEATGFALPTRAATGHQRRMSLLGLAARWMLDARFFGEAVEGYWPLGPFLVDGAPYGGLVGPVSNLLRMGQAMLAGGRGAKGRLLGEKSAREMLAPFRDHDGRELPVGLGWRLGTVGDEPYAHHLGGGGGFRSELRIYPRLGYAVAIAASETSFDTDGLARLVVR